MKSFFLITILLLTPFFVIADTKVMLPDSGKFTRNEPDIFVQTTIPGDFKTIEGIMTALFLLVDQAKDTSLSNPFTPNSISDPSQRKGAKHLGAYYRGVRRLKNTVIISFSEEAMLYLNNTVSIQHVVKGTMERTLKLHFPDITEIQYEIDGKIITDWDA